LGANLGGITLLVAEFLTLVGLAILLPLRLPSGLAINGCRIAFQISAGLRVHSYAIVTSLIALCTVWLSCIETA
jgi:hypothetical protein